MNISVHDGDLDLSSRSAGFLLERDAIGLRGC